MSGGTNGPLIYDGAPYQLTVRTLSQLRQRLMIRLGFAAQLAYPPAGMVALLNDFLIDAQEQMYHRCEPLRNQRWWPIKIKQGERHYDVPAISTGEITADFTNNSLSVDTVERTDGGNFFADGFTPGMLVTAAGAGLNNKISFVIASVETDKLTLSAAGVVITSAGETVTLTTANYANLDMRQISEQWLTDGTRWSRMVEGINPALFNSDSQSYPTFYEWSDHLEIWPSPDKDYTIYVKGHFGLLPFIDDDDTTTIDDNIVWLHAIANAKTHYGQKDAGTYYRQLEVLLGRLNKEAFGNKRFVPNADLNVKVLSKPEATWR